MLADIGGAWGQVLTKSFAKYLGFFIGPGRDDSIWAKPVSKWLLRVRGWKGHALGLQYSALVYKVFCASVLSFPAQLEPVPDAVHAQEEAAMLALAQGPKAWANKSDLWRMGEQCGVGRSFRCIKARSEAAMLRAYHLECWERPVSAEARRLRNWETASDQHDRMVFWQHWYKRSSPRVLLHNKETMKKRSITL